MPHSSQNLQGDTISLIQELVTGEYSVIRKCSEIVCQGDRETVTTWLKERREYLLNKNNPFNVQ